MSAEKSENPPSEEGWQYKRGGGEATVLDDSLVFNGMKFG
jgi:hypothetical protein